MKYWIYLCTVYILTYCTDQHIVVLEQVPKAAKSEDTKHVDPSSQGSQGSGSGEGIVQKSEENAEQELSGGSSNDHTKQSSDADKLDPLMAENDLSEGETDSESDNSHAKNNLEKQLDDNTLYILKVPDHSQYNSAEKARKTKNWNRWVAEIMKGNKAEMMGTNPHIYQPDTYNDLGRRFVLQYPYDIAKNLTEDNVQLLHRPVLPIQVKKEITEYAPPGQEIIPIRAPSQKVAEKIALESALRLKEQKIRTNKVEEKIPIKKLLRTGDYWNGVWKEDVDPRSPLRSQLPNSLGVVKAKVKPGTEFYNVVSKMKEISPRLLYIINANQ